MCYIKFFLAGRLNWFFEWQCCKYIFALLSSSTSLRYFSYFESFDELFIYPIILWPFFWFVFCYIICPGINRLIVWPSFIYLAVDCYGLFGDYLNLGLFIRLTRLLLNVLFVREWWFYYLGIWGESLNILCRWLDICLLSSLLS